MFALDVGEAIEIFVKTKPALQISEQAVNWDAGSFEAGRAAHALWISPDRRFGGITRWRSDFHSDAKVTERRGLSAKNCIEGLSQFIRDRALPHFVIPMTKFGAS